ncbi:MAG TPA: metalloregulator ArsR/SmtB family transcription factor [Polyangiaceae bacterium]|nr:metalloregulator ArsR/SmtB family transcription factor [Polyangiaceae bacterium]
MIETFAALAEPNRYRIVELLRTSERTVGELGERLELSQPLVSKHLRILKEADLVQVEPRARERVYTLRAKRLREMSGWLERYRKIWDARFDALDDLVRELEAKEKSHERRKGR